MRRNLRILGNAVALSGDGNTLLVGTRLGDVARIFTRTNGVWDPQGTKLVATGESGNSLQGFSVGLSSDGNTALVGGPQDDSNTGATWVFTRTNGAWSQMGSKLVGTGAVGSPGTGNAVAISGDGNTALLGRPLDDAKYLNQATGAAWVFARSDPRALGIGALVNAASLAQGSGAANTIMSAFGNFPVCKDTAQVLVDGVETTVFYSGASQVNFLVPPSVAGEPSASVKIACNGVSSPTVILPVVPAAPALFTVTQNGIGQAAVINQDGSVATASPAGTSISLFGTGFGVLGQPGPDGLARLTAPITASIGVLPVKVLYAGEAPGYTSGLQQINVQLPDNTPRGPRIDIQIFAAGISTQAGVTLNVP